MEQVRENRKYYFNINSPPPPSCIRNYVSLLSIKIMDDRNNTSMCGYYNSPRNSIMVSYNISKIIFQIISNINKRQAMNIVTTSAKPIFTKYDNLIEIKKIYILSSNID